MAALTTHHPQPVYLVDFSVYKPAEQLKVDRELCEERGKAWSMYSDTMKDFMVKVVERSGLGQNSTYLPQAINPMFGQEPKNDMATAMLEAKTVMCGAVEELLNKTGLRASDIDILVTNCSIFCPTPSLASMLINHFKFRTDIQSYHLGGMGCGNGVMAVGLIRDLLQARPNSIALFVPAEITTYAFYPGAHKQYMVANCIFRMGGAAVALTNRKSYSRTAKYQLQYNVRVHTGQADDSYGCMSWGPDPDGVNGVYLGKNVVSCAAEAIRYCLQSLTPRIMTWGQYAEAVVHIAKKNLWDPEMPEYMPDYTKCVDHFAIHAGGYAVLKGVQQGVNLPAHHMIPSFAALRDYGNTSCSTTWYIMAYMESCEKVLKGQKIMQLGMGGGMKAGINIWRALRNNNTVHPAWRHVANCPLTEADLPRAIEPIKIDLTPGLKRAADGIALGSGAPAPDVAAAVKSDVDVVKPVARKLTIDVKAFTDQQSELTDDQLADLAH